MKRLYRQNWSAVSGGFLAGDTHTIGQFHTLFSRKFIELIQRNYIDDDQTTLVMAIKSRPSLFNVVIGDWYDGFKKFDPIFASRVTRRRRRRLLAHHKH